MEEGREKKGEANVQAFGFGYWSIFAIFEMKKKTSITAN